MRPLDCIRCGCVFSVGLLSNRRTFKCNHAIGLLSQGQTAVLNRKNERRFEEVWLVWKVMFDINYILDLERAGHKQSKETH